MIKNILVAATVMAAPGVTGSAQADDDNHGFRFNPLDESGCARSMQKRGRDD